MTVIDAPSAISEFISAYDAARLSVEPLRLAVLAGVEKIQDEQSRLECALFLYWRAETDFKVQELCKALSIDPKEFRGLPKKIQGRLVEDICKACQRTRFRPASSRSDRGGSFFCVFCDEERVVTEYIGKLEQGDATRSYTDQVKVLRAMPYTEYLLTDHWKNLRQQKLKSAKFRCELCFSPNSLQVHHKTYERRGAELLTDLIVLCRPCHARHHGKEK